jgi:cytochrome P450
MHKYRIPPGNKNEILFSTLHSFLDPCGYFESMSQRHGYIFTDNFLVASNVVFVAEPRAIEKIFSSDPNLFRSTKENTSPDPLLGGESLLFLNGDKHRRRKKLLMPPFHAERLKEYAETIRNITLDVMRENYFLGRFNARVTAQRITLSTILQCVFGLYQGRRYEELRNSLAKHLDFFDNPFTAALSLFDFLRLDLGEWSPWGTVLRNLASIDRLIYEEINERRSRSELLGKDVLSLLLQAEDEEGKKLGDTELRDELALLLIAGHETTSLSIAWALYWIHFLPNVQKKLRQELSSVDLQDIAEVNKLPYLNAVCLETLRIYPVVLGSISRVLQEPMELEDYYLPKETIISIPIYLVHHREDLYPDPKRFDPERFLNRNYSPCEFLPFGGGNRRCIGSALALLEMKISLATILSEYRLSLVEHRPLRPVRRGLVFAPEGGVDLRVDN